MAVNQNTTGEAAIELTDEQQEELSLLVQELKQVNATLTSIEAILGHAWITYFDVLSLWSRFHKNPPNSKMCKQLQSERRKSVKLLHRFFKHTPTIADAKLVLPQVVQMSASLAEVLDRDLDQLDKPIPRRSQLEVLQERQEKLVQRVEKRLKRFSEEP